MSLILFFFIDLSFDAPGAALFAILDLYPEGGKLIADAVAKCPVLFLADFGAQGDDQFDQLARKIGSLVLEGLFQLAEEAEMDRQMEEAKHLLLEGDRPVYEVAALVGVRDYNYFTKLFKAKCGATPTEFRKTHMH